MNFLSLPYAFFLLSVFLLFYALPHRHQWKLLLTSSIFFYMTYIPQYICIPIFIGIVSYGAGLLIERSQRPVWGKTILIMNLATNIGILAVFKYVNFMTGSFFKVINFIQIHSLHAKAVDNPLVLNWLVPLGISYITFQAIGYTIEIYRGNQRAEKHMGLFLTYLMFFPKLLSGPIERAHNFLPQLYEEHPFDYERVTNGLKLIAWGAFKKIVIADRLASFVSVVYDKPGNYQGISFIVAAVFFTFQLYCDFSGYTDIAIGSANVLGFQLMKNFNFPFISRSMAEFWRRWHISLSTWFFEYVYNPVVIATRDWVQWAVVYAIVVTFFILGLWHGASWKFVIFGLLQGMILSIEFLTKRPRKIISSKLPGRVNHGLGVVLTFVFFSFTLIFFRARNLSDAWYIVSHLFAGIPDFFITVIHRQGPLGTNMEVFQPVFLGNRAIEFCVTVMLIIFLMAVEAVQRRGDIRIRLSQQPAWVRWGCYCALIVFILIFGYFDISQQFIYFKF